MKHLVLLFALVLAVPTFADPLTGNQRNRWKESFTEAGYLGEAPFAADPATCATATKRARYYNTATNAVIDSEAGGGTIILNLAPPKVLIDIKG